MKNTTAVGDRSEGAVLAALLKAEMTVLLPFGGGQRYDLVFEDKGVFRRVQCKTGRVESGAVVFSTCSWGRGSKRLSYGGQCDLFGVYCPSLDKVYLVPVGDVPERGGSLRIDPARNGQQSGVRYASQYELHGAIVQGEDI